MKQIDVVRLAKMALRASALSIALAFANPLAAEEPTSSTHSETTPAGPAMWVVRDPDSTLYLFGTMHVLSTNSQWNSPRLAEATADSEEIWFEIEPPTDPAAMQSIIMEFGVDAANPLSSKLTPDEYRLFAEAVTSMGMQASQLDSMRPWLAAVTLTGAPMIQAGYDPASGADAILLAAAKQAGRTVKTFESTEQQMRFFADLPAEVELQFLREALANYRQGPDLVRQMESLWTSGDMEGLWRVAGEPMKTGSPEVYSSLITVRNRVWAERLQQELAGSGTDFVAVGALHLVGPDSVQSMLEAMGYTVERR